MAEVETTRAAGLRGEGGRAEQARPAAAEGAVLAVGLWAAWAGITLGLWASAFAPASEAPAWLGRLQSVCFGTLPSGLPDSYGWGMLTVGPLSILAGLIAIYRVPLGLAVVAAGRSLPWALGLGVPLLALLGEGVWVGERIREGLSRAAPLEPLGSGVAGGLPEDLPRGQAPAPGWDGLVNQRGEAASLAGLRGRVVVLTFAFAHCEAICPLIVRQLREVTAASGAEVVPVVITLDPWRDTPSALPALAASWELPATAEVLSGEPARVEAVLDAYGVSRTRNPETGDVVHPARVVVIDRQARLAYSLDAAPDAWLSDAIRRAGGAASAPADEVRH